MMSTADSLPTLIPCPYIHCHEPRLRSTDRLRFAVHASYIAFDGKFKTGWPILVGGLRNDKIRPALQHRLLSRNSWLCVPLLRRNPRTNRIGRSAGLSCSLVRRASLLRLFFWLTASDCDGRGGAHQANQAGHRCVR